VPQGTRTLSIKTIANNSIKKTVSNKQLNNSQHSVKKKIVAIAHAGTSRAVPRPCRSGPRRAQPAKEPAALRPAYARDRVTMFFILPCQSNLAWTIELTYVFLPALGFSFIF
jgi:hypothetical protein